MYKGGRVAADVRQRKQMTPLLLPAFLGFDAAVKTKINKSGCKVFRGGAVL